MFSETHSDSQRADRILASIRREEARPGRGLLKIFFGMAPGVGKTCAMLEAAIQAADKGVQVIIGVAESHGREDTTHWQAAAPSHEKDGLPGSGNGGI